jgi:hypothetical protein
MVKPYRSGSSIIVIFLSIVFDLFHLMLDLLHQVICQLVLGFGNVFIINLVRVELLVFAGDAQLPIQSLLV